ncbi:MAG: hypothetical protein K2I91_02235 [Muribaculaceae bacterium]|nr:hypothetical protein [Muribaculaceae bacterium]
MIALIAMIAMIALIALITLITLIALIVLTAQIALIGLIGLIGLTAPSAHTVMQCVCCGRNLLRLTNCSAAPPARLYNQKKDTPEKDTKKRQPCFTAVLSQRINFNFYKPNIND